VHHAALASLPNTCVAIGLITRHNPLPEDHPAILVLGDIRVHRTFPPQWRT